MILTQTYKLSHRQTHKHSSYKDLKCKHVFNQKYYKLCLEKCFRGNYPNLHLKLVVLTMSYPFSNLTLSLPLPPTKNKHKES